MRSETRWSVAHRIGLVAAALVVLAGCARHGRYTGAFKEKAELRVSQLKAGTQWDMAQQQFLSGDLEKALVSIDQSIAFNPEVTKSHVLQARILIELGRLEGALKSIDAALALDEKFTDAHYYKGIVLERFSMPDLALEAYRKAFETDPTNPQYLVAGAEMLIDAGRLDEAEAVLTEARRGFEHNAGVRQTLGHIQMIRGESREAVTLFSEASLLAPDDLGLQEDLARAQVASEMFAEADTTLRRLLAKQDKSPRRDLMQLRVKCLLELNRPVEARTALLRLTSDEQGETDVPSWILLGNVSLLLGDEHRLRECGQRLIAMAPERPEGYGLLAIWQRTAGHPEAAAKTIERAASLGVADASTLVLQGLIYQDLGRTDAASRSFAAALERDPSSRDARRLLERSRAVTSGMASVPTEP